MPKKCRKCGITKHYTKFQVRPDNGRRRHVCTQCISIQAKETYWEKKKDTRWYKERLKRARLRGKTEKYRAYQRAWAVNNRDKGADKQRRRSVTLRKEMIEAYGSRCVCCNEDIPQFMTLDHKYGDGKKDRTEIGAGIHLYNHLRKKGWPKRRYRLLCMNCNASRGWHGFCPHPIILDELIARWEKFDGSYQES